MASLDCAMSRLSFASETVGRQTSECAPTACALAAGGLCDDRVDEDQETTCSTSGLGETVSAWPHLSSTMGKQMDGFHTEADGKELLLPKYTSSVWRALSWKDRSLLLDIMESSRCEIKKKDGGAIMGSLSFQNWTSTNCGQYLDTMSR